MKTVGLTGGIATGKSTVARILRDDLHLPVIDADKVSRDVTAQGSAGLAWIVEAFGSDILARDGSLDRAALGRVVMDDPARRRRLEEITHPLIREEIENRLAALEQAGAAVAVVEAALMVETGSYKLYDAVVVVSCEPSTQLRRLQERNGLSEAEARKWLAAQMSLAEKESVATVVIRNDASHAELRQSVLDAWRSLAL